MIFLDFDGTLIDLWPRYHAVFTDLCELTGISLDLYKKAKREFHKDELVANHFGKELPAMYFEKKAQLLEDKNYLRLDRLFLSVNLINQTFQNSNAVLLTKRRNKANFLWELDELGIRIRSKVLCSQSKKEWIQANYNNEKCYIFGDYLNDLEAASLENVDAYMVLFGLGTENQFAKANIPYEAVDTPEQIIELARNI